MSEIFLEVSDLAIDAEPQLRFNVKENEFNPKFSVERLVHGLSLEDYKSAFFLLMDKDIEPKNFIESTNKDLPHLQTKFIKICEKYSRDETILIELFGTLKMYKKLRLFNTCFHVHESQSNQFKRIEKIWKILYELCEEITDQELKILKQKVPESSCNIIQSAEDWFCWALVGNIFSRTDLSGLETIFKEYPNCLDIIKSFKVFTEFEFYPMKVSSSSSACGIALILNYDEFENPGLSKRHYSEKDVESLKELWKNFGFEIKDCPNNLSCSETFKELKDCASIDHSNFDAFVCCILSHGKSDSVYSSDGKLMRIDDLIWPIMNECSTLIDKPKLFFIQACQGENILQGPGRQVYQLETDKTPPVGDTTKSPPITIDHLISKSTIDGFVSFRNREGSWFIQTFCKIMSQYGETYTIEEILMKVNNETSKLSVNFGPLGDQRTASQMPVYINTLRKKLILKKRSK